MSENKSETTEVAETISASVTSGRVIHTPLRRHAVEVLFLIN